MGVEPKNLTKPMKQQWRPDVDINLTYSMPATYVRFMDQLSSNNFAKIGAFSAHKAPKVVNLI